MSPAAQREAIATYCGWEYCEATQQMVFVKDGDILGFDWPSLDAMHEAELLLSFDQQTSFVQNLMCQHKDYPMTSAFFATAAQRAEAFLRTLNLWEPDTAPTAG